MIFRLTRPKHYRGEPCRPNYFCDLRPYKKVREGGLLYRCHRIRTNSNHKLFFPLCRRLCPAMRQRRRKMTYSTLSTSGRPPTRRIVSIGPCLKECVSIDLSAILWTCKVINLSLILQLSQDVCTAIRTLLGNFAVLLGNFKIQMMIWPWKTLNRKNWYILILIYI